MISAAILLEKKSAEREGCAPKKEQG